jgi:hypothetical protein
MPKDKRGGKSLKKEPYAEYEEIGKANNGTIKVLKAKSDADNAAIPQFSNKANTVYFITKQTGNADKVTSIAVYRGRKVVRNVDIDPVMGDHYHVWQTKTVRGKIKQVKGKKHYFDLKASDKKLIQMALNWNSGGK